MCCELLLYSLYRSHTHSDTMAADREGMAIFLSLYNYRTWIIEGMMPHNWPQEQQSLLE